MFLNDFPLFQSDLIFKLKPKKTISKKFSSNKDNFFSIPEDVEEYDEEEEDAQNLERSETFYKLSKFWVIIFDT
jgi:hypothetical protein